MVDLIGQVVDPSKQAADSLEKFADLHGKEIADSVRKIVNFTEEETVPAGFKIKHEEELVKSKEVVDTEEKNTTSQKSYGAFGSFDKMQLIDDFLEDDFIEDAFEESEKTVFTKNKTNVNDTNNQNKLLDMLEKFDNMSIREMFSACSPAVLKCSGILKSMSTSLLNKIKIGKIIKAFEKGTIVESGKFIFAKNNASLMLMKYSGIEKSVEIPASVGGLPVQFLHPDFLSGGLGIKNNYRVRGVVNFMSSDNPDMLDTSDVLSTDFAELILPNTLTMIFDKSFVGARNLESLYVPASVYFLSNNAFKFSKIKNIYFNGRCPKGFTRLPEGCTIFVKKEYEESFRRLQL